MVDTHNVINISNITFILMTHWTNIYCRPPRKIEFLNTYGAVINCLVHGDPIPKVQWINKNGQNVEDIHGLLKKLENNSLSLPKFDNGLYRQNIHATTYICKASNKYGTIISREIQVTAVVDQQYSTQVYDEYVIEGNTALLKCIIPSYIKDQIIVTAWIRDDGVRISSEYQQDSRYLILNTGDLNIFNVRYGDSDNVYKCQTKHTVSGEVKVTDVGGKLHVTKPSSGIQPRIVYSTPSMNIVSGSEITLSSVAQGFPAPAYSWCYQKYRGLSCEEITKSTEKTIVGNSLIIRASMKDSGFYVCKAENKMGDDTVKLKLTVFAPLSAFIHPQRQIVDIGQAINIGCVISGGPFTFIKWFKDGKFLKKDIEKLNSSKSSLHISNVEKTTEGMYQCFVGNVMDEKQAIGQIILSAVPPTIVKEFKMQHKRSGQSLTLECAATGDPLPQIQWILRDSIIKKSFGLNIESKVDSGKIWSKLTINILQISNSGIYKCIAKNKAGKDMYSNTLHVYGPPRVWPLMNQTVVTGKSVFIQCHVSGYPISSINWKKDDEDLLENERIKIYSNGSLKILSAIRDIDNGKYKCTAENEEGYTSSGSGILRILVAPILNEINDQSLRFGRRLSLYCSLTAGDPPIEFTWLYNGQALPHYLGLVVSDSTYSSTLNHQNIRGEHMGNYTCIAKNNPGSASVSAFIKVEAPPEWLMKPTSVEVHLGESISLPCTGKGFPQPKSTWLKLKVVRTLMFYEKAFNSFKIFSGRQLEKLGNLQNERIIYKNGTLSLISISEDDLQITYRCKISNRIQPSLVANIKLILKKNKIIFDILKSTFQVSVGDSCDIKCKATGIGPFNVQWIYSSKTLSSVSDQRYCFIPLGSVIILFKLNTGGDNKAGSDDNKDFGYPLFTSIITPTDESYKNDSSRDVHFRSVAILYIIPTVTAAVILLVILIIVCILLQRQREKRTKYKNEARKLEHSNMRSQNLEEDDKISDFYKTSSVTSSSNKYYEIRPHHPYQQSHSSAFKPGISHEAKGTGPIFILEPQRKVAFLNSHGTVINCLVHGEPTPTVHWINKRNELVQDVSGLLRNLANNSLSLSKFSNGQYQQAIHATTYRCKATNKYGTIISRKVYVTAERTDFVISNCVVVGTQFYLFTQVYDEYVIEGNTAVLKCIIPSYIKDYVKVTAWIKDDKIEITNKYEKDSKYLIMGNGNLIIIRVNMDDALSMYKCQTKHLVSKQVVITHNGGKLHITTPSSGIAPKIIESSPELQSRPGERIILPCLFQGYPSPSYSWCFKKTMKDQCKSLTDAMEERLIGSSLILTSSDKDSGFYVCVAANEMGKETSVVKLTVFVLKKLIIMIITNFITFLDSLSVFIHPQRQMVEIGQSVSLSCVVAGGPFTSINWIKDGKFLKEDEGALASSVSILNISEVKMNSEGMYQCFVQNGQDEKQAVGQIILSAIPPSIVKTFNRKQKRPGEGVTLECSATGEPLPQMAWLLRELEIKNSSRTNIEVKEKNGKVTIKLTISFLQTEDGGMYTCMAENKVGKASYTEIMDVYGVPRVWPLVNQTVVDGKPVTINCHVSGYPIKSIYWTKVEELKLTGILQTDLNCYIAPPRILVPKYPIVPLFAYGYRIFRGNQRGNTLHGISLIKFAKSAIIFLIFCNIFNSIYLIKVYIILNLSYSALKNSPSNEVNGIIGGLYNF
ncbi:Down syndrome cell adhesion molecule-like protein Dscam2 [Nymphon striatum]|nr:Down syndrome cell adhesion molecule-like protein Dscam2 [Nymphon striatum]